MAVQREDTIWARWWGVMKRRISTTEACSTCTDGEQVHREGDVLRWRGRSGSRCLMALLNCCHYCHCPRCSGPAHTERRAGMPGGMSWRVCWSTSSCRFLRHCTGSTSVRTAVREMGDAGRVA